MSDPADKSDDLIAELAKLMATQPGNKPAAAPPPRPAPAANGTAAPSPVRIPGMDPMAARPAPAAPQADRGPVTGSIRIPGMDQPAPVSTSAPVGKFDFGKPVSAPSIKQDPIPTLAERIARQDAAAPRPEPVAQQPAPSPVRIPSSLTPVSENRSFAQGPALSVSRPNPAPAPIPAPVAAAPAPAVTPAPAPAGDFHFDFGFAQNPPVSATPPRPQPDPIADLIEADLAGPDTDDAPEHEPQPEPEAPRVAPVIRAVPVQPAKPTIAPVSAAPARPVAATPIPLKPVSVAPRSAETDRFAISPGVGLNMKPPASQPLSPPPPRAPEPPAARDLSDPMSEIESLIGEAVRVELSPGPVRVQAPQMVSARVELEPEEELEAEIHHRPEPAPVVPPLTTQFAPRRSHIKDDVGSNAAEDAILAAAAASGAEVGRIEPAIGDESPYRRLKVKPQRTSFLSGGMRQYVGMAVAGTLLLAAGLGLYWVLNMGRAQTTTGASAPQLTADTTPVKVKPAETAKPETDAAKSPVLAKIDGASSAPSSEQLVSTDETNGGAVTRDVTPATDTGENGLANRKVRTVTVRPDGTIVSGDDAVAGGEELPVDRPNVPDVPSTETTSLLGTDTTVAAAEPATTAPETTTAATTATEEAIAPVIDPTAVAPTPLTFPVRSAATQPLALDTPAPTNSTVNALTGAQTPNGQIDLLGGDAQPVEEVAVAKPTPAPADSGNAAAYVQLSSQPTQADAQAAVKSQTAKFGSLFGGNKLVIQQADLGQKGIRYRVRLPAASLSEANSICAQIKSQGGDCFATNG